MRSKGIQALHIIFTLFILIIVTLIVIRMFTQYFRFEKITKTMEKWEEIQGIEAARAQCAMACDNWLEDRTITTAQEYCQSKVKLDIDGNKRTNEAGHGGIVKGVPYCEDGLYCFHIHECRSGTYELTPERCLLVSCEYYQKKGMDKDQAIQATRNFISYGTCEPDPNDWGVRIEGWKPIDADYISYDPDGNEIGPMSIIGADWWWVKAGYASPNCEDITTGTTTTTTIPATLSNCVLDKATSPWSFSCDTGCSDAAFVTVSDTDGIGSAEMNPSITGGTLTSTPSVPNTLNDLKCPDTWTVLLDCESPDEDYMASMECT